MKPRNIIVCFGTRPEAIKLAPVVKALQQNPERFKTIVCVTAQHREMLDQALAAFDIEPDIDLNLMRPNQSLAGLTARVLVALDSVLRQADADWLIVQGDTTSTMAAAMCAFYHKVPVGHVEAGLRTDNKFSPYPEEINRRLTTQMSDLHFAPTERAKANLLRDGVAADRILVTGNTVIDALQLAREKIRSRQIDWVAGLRKPLNGQRVVGVTAHRRENFGEGLRSLCRALRRLADRFVDVEFVYPVHLNPNVRQPVFEILGDRDNIHLIEPLDYLPFVAFMERSYLLMSDSGGIQEEAPTLGKPVLVMRDTTERPEAVEAGTAKLVGTSEENLFQECAHLLTDSDAYAAMSKAKNPFGDGRAAERIIDALNAP